MSIALEELIKIVGDKNLKLVAGATGLRNVVSWVHVVENTQISEFLEGQEIAITTGVGLETPEDLMEIVRYNYKMNASGMIINIGPFIDKIPTEVIDYANEHDFPIFEVPWHIHMSKIMRDFSAILLEAEKEQLILSGAIENAIKFAEEESSYIPTMEKYHLMRDWSYCICAIDLEDNLGNVVHSNIKEKIGKIVERNVVHDFANSVVMCYENQILIILAKYNQEDVRKIIEQVYKKTLQQLPENCNSYWGVGENTKSVRCIVKSYKKAVKCIGLERSKSEKNKLTFYSDMGIYKILMSVEQDSLLKEYYQEVLGKLEEYDHINNSSLLDELKVYFDCECNIQATAERLFMHRNSIRYKINKIQEILGMNLDSQIDRNKIMTAFCIKDLV